MINSTSNTFIADLDNVIIRERDGNLYNPEFNYFTPFVATSYPPDKITLNGKTHAIYSNLSYIIQWNNFC